MVVGELKVLVGYTDQILLVPPPLAGPELRNLRRAVQDLDLCSSMNVSKKTEETRLLVDRLNHLRPRTAK